MDIKEILEKHLAWLRNEENGERAVLTGADLTDADLTGAVLSRAVLSSAFLTRANLTGAVLTGTILSDSKGLLTAREFMSKFKHDKLGVIVYKLIGDTYYKSPDYWNIIPGSFLEEVVNPLPTLDCACGVNFATLEWCEKNENYSKSKLWKCRIRWIDLADVVVPYNTDGKARCGRLELLEIVPKD